MSPKPYYTKEEYEAAKQVSIAAFLMGNGYELEREGHCYKGKLHDSLVIRDDGRWYWNSRDLHGYSPIELYKQILIHDYGYHDEMEAKIEAVKRMAGNRGGIILPTAENTPLPKPTRLPGESLPVPAPYRNNNRVMVYLCKTRGLDAGIVRELIRDGMIYETVQSWDKDKKCFYNTPHHNTVFLTFDSHGNPQNGFLRGTISKTDKPFKRDLDFSDKSYPFILRGHPDSDRVIFFEAIIDAISHKCIYNTDDWRIPLGGLNYAAMERFLSEHPQITRIVSGFDNDEAGHRYSQKLYDKYSNQGYEVTREIPIRKDWNDDLNSIYCNTMVPKPISEPAEDEQTGGMSIQ